MEEDSTPDAKAQDGAQPSPDEDFDITSEDTSTPDPSLEKASADSGDDAGAADDDNAPSGADEESGDDESTEEADDADKALAFDKDLDDWAEKRGYGKLETDRERRMAQDARNNQRDYSKRSEARKSAEKLANAVADTAKEDIKEADDDADPLAKDVADLKTQLTTERQNRQVSDFFLAMAEANTPVSEAQADAMGELLAQTAKTDGKGGVDFLVKNIPRWHKLAISEMGTDAAKEDTATITEKVRQEERARIAKKQQAAGPNRSAKATVPAKEKDELAKIWEDDSI